MKAFEKYCKNIQKKSKKLLNKLFGFTSLSQGVKERNNIRDKLEKVIGKDISMITNQELKENKLYYDFCKYRTLDKIVSLYIESVILNEE